MVDTAVTPPDRLRPLTGLVSVYVGVVIVTLGVLAVLSAVGSTLATQEAWGHAVVVALFAVLLVLRLRAARRGSAAALRAVMIIAAVLVVVNVVEAVVPGLFPIWMRAEMIGLAALMAAIAVVARRPR